ncbi:F-box/kelch-repeat protein At3g06240-like [Papaver somniferum]|uniref:F-box/kelch-repeat protein At3g06240-like n=1 Tax=Papaver somniferum TaxID=3469 RepID=UPI000E6F9E4D|nr:F-box/kelch-repeat protein At3g06240-like [Papaver somniferum]
MDYPFNSRECSVDLLGCCHGLVCLWLENRDTTFLCLWNPATKEYKQVPKSPDDHDDMNQMSMVAFGYDSKNDDYKLLTRFDNLVQVYSLGLNSWKRIGNVEFRSLRDAGVLVNGDLHWLAESQDSSRQIVVSLDMSEEIFKEMQLPKTSVSRPHRFMKVGALEGCLCVLGSDICLQVEVWVMQDYGVHESWTKRYVINHESVSNDYLLRLVWSFKSGEILFGISSNGSLISYDPNYRRLRPTNLLRVTHIEKEGSYCESLISLNSNTYQGRTRGTNRVPRHRAGLDSLD